MRQILLLIATLVCLSALSQQFPNSLTAKESMKSYKIALVEKAETPNVDTVGRYYLVLFKLTMDSIHQLHNANRSLLPPYKPNKEKDLLNAAHESYAEIKKRDADIKAMKERVAWYKHQYNNYIMNTGDFRIFLPTWSRALDDTTFVQYVFSQSTFTPVTSLQGQGAEGQASVYTELLGTNIGHLRISLGSLLAANKSTDSSKQTIQSFLTSGGNLSFNAYYPLAYFSTNSYYFLLQYSPKMAFQVPGMGSYTDKYTWNLQPLSLDLNFDIDSYDKSLGLFFFTRWALAFGSPDFYANMGYSDHKAFTYATLNIGAVINSSLRIMATGPIYGAEQLKRSPWGVGVSLVPSSKHK